MVSVEIISIKKNDFDNSSLITYKVSNLFGKNIFLVADNWFTWHYHDALIEINFARTRMIEGVSVFGYFLPELQKMEPRNSVVKEISLKWPLKLNTIWNKQNYANPEKGAHRLKIKIGYGFSEKIDMSETQSVEDSVMNWQKVSESRESIIHI